MEGLIHINFAKIDFQCPYCGKKYMDDEEKYIDGCNKRMSGCCRIKCECGKPFGMTYDITSQAVGFKLEKNE